MFIIYIMNRDMRNRMYNVYNDQIPLMGYSMPVYSNQDMYGQGCYNCSVPFHLGSGSAKRPRRPRKSSRRGSRRGTPREYSKVEKLGEDWEGLVNELIPIGYDLKDIAKTFYNAYQVKHGGDLHTLLKMMNQYEYY